MCKIIIIRFSLISANCSLQTIVAEIQRRECSSLTRSCANCVSVVVQLKRKSLHMLQTRRDKNSARNFLYFVIYFLHQRFILSIKSYFSTSYEKGEIYYKDLFSVKFSTFSHLQLIIKIIIILSVKLIVKIILYVKRATLFYQIYLVKKLISAEMSSLI